MYTNSISIFVELITNSVLPTLLLFNLIGTQILTEHTPAGCYGYKQFQDMKFGSSNIIYYPITPHWCLNSNMVPKYLSNVHPQNSTPPYEIIVHVFTLSDAMEVIVRSKDGNLPIHNFYIVAKAAGKNLLNSETRIGRFGGTESISSVCCDFIDQNAATVRKQHSGWIEYSVYWLPEQKNDTDYYDGNLYFKATVVQDNETYWIGIKSDIVTTKADPHYDEEVDSL